VNDCNERIVRHGLKVIRSSDDQDPGDHSGSGGESGCNGEQRNPSTQNQPNQGSLLIDATCTPVDIRHPTDLSLLNVDEVFSEGVAREVTEILIDAMYPQIRESFGHKPRTHRRKARHQQDPQGYQAAARTLEAKPLEH
jgi:IS5 family transposase